MNQFLRFVAQHRTITILFFASHLGFIYFLGNNYSFAPDEQSYNYLLVNLYNSEKTISDFRGYQFSNLFFLRLIYFPPFLIFKLGVDPLISIRIYSIMITYLCLIILLYQARNNKFLKVKIRYLIIFVFMTPSIFVWTSLGLKECLIYLSFVSMFCLINKYFFNQKRLYLFSILLTFIILFLIKSYLYSLLILSFLILCTLLLIFNKNSLKKFHLNLSVCLFIPLIIFPSTTNQLYWLYATNIKSAFFGQSPDIVLLPEYLESSNSKINLPIKKIPVQVIETVTIKNSNLNNFDKIESLNIQTILHQSLRVLVLPIPFISTKNILLDFYSFESIIWYFYYFLLIIIYLTSIIKKLEINFLSNLSLIYIIFFIFHSSFYESNIGTLIRHRSLILILILIFLININLSLKINSNLRQIQFNNLIRRY